MQQSSSISKQKQLFLDNVVPDLDEATAIEFTSEGLLILKYFPELDIRNHLVYIFTHCFIVG